MKPMTDLGVDVVGVSGDSPATQALFRKEHGLPYALLGDETGAVAKAFGVPLKAGGKVKHKDQELTRGVTAARWTFIIGKDGKIAYKNTKVAPGEDGKAVLEALSKLK
jgi:thioredoxin-dependent peroxiredoxin